ncbi:MAG: hypothetical protein AMXMBFR84_28840 [Candidatus Hydrogenedentota bacterium]
MERSEQTAANSVTSLSAIAFHERKLLGDLEQIKRDARALIEEARQESLRRMAASERDLAEETSRIMQAARDACERERAALLAATRTRLEAETAEARTRFQKAADEVVNMVLPGQTGLR